jgi:hypothetical protein
MGPKGDKGDPGTSGLSLRIVRPNASSATCNADEIIVSAVCNGQSSRLPLTTDKSARCESDGNTVTILCAKL